VGVLSSSQLVGTNVGVRLPESIELQQERKNSSNKKKESDTESKANSDQSLPLTQCGVCAGIFIGVGQGSYYNALNTPNDLPHQ
jgi:hypothetical protein